MIYLDHAAMTPPLPCAMGAYKNAPFGNPSSEHAAGQAARDALESARKKISSLMDCEPDEIYFTATATEAAAIVMRSMHQADVEVTASPFEHHAVSENVNPLPLTRSIYARALAQMLVNNETGEIFPPVFIPVHDYYICDATSAVGHIPVSFKRVNADYLIADAIKFGGVPGAAFLIAKKNAPLSPMIFGGGQERGMRSGTENVPAICAMAATLEWQMEHMKENTAMVSDLQEMMVHILSKIPGRKFNTPLDKSYAPHILNVSFDGVDAHALALHLSNNGVMVSPGAACSNGLNEPSHVIMAMFNDEQRARSAIRISISHETTIDDCVKAISEIKNAVEYLRSLN